MKTREIIGNTTATPNPRPDWEQMDETKADYIKNKPDVVKMILSQTGGIKFIINENGKLTLLIEEE